LRAEIAAGKTDNEIAAEYKMAVGSVNNRRILLELQGEFGAQGAPP
jgi:hypothetical protein